MVSVKVRETYDLHTTRGKMTVIGIHTPRPDIIKKNYPGLLMQCRCYRPVSADVKIACASVLPLDPQGVGLAEGDVAPEDIFNPILYKAMSNKGMSQLEAKINGTVLGLDVDGSSASVDVDSTTQYPDEFPIYYGLLSNTHEWKHANPQAGLSMKGLRPLVYEMVYNVGDARTQHIASSNPAGAGFPSNENFGNKSAIPYYGIIGKAKEFPWLNCTSYSYVNDGQTSPSGFSSSGFPNGMGNSEIDVPDLKVYCGCIIIPPSRLHELFYRMVVEWTVEFSGIRPMSEIVNWYDLNAFGDSVHYQNYSYSATKEALTGDSESVMDSDACMVSANVDVTKVM